MHSTCDSIMVGCNPVRISSLQLAAEKAAGQEWARELQAEKQHHRPGEVWVMGAGEMPYPHVYMAMTPVWDGNIWNEEKFLVHCFINTMELIDIMSVKSIAIPLLGTGKHRFPDERAVRLAVQTCMEYAPQQLEKIVFTAIDPEIFDMTQERLEKEQEQL